VAGAPDTAEVAALRLEGKPLAAPPVEVVLGTQASAASPAEAEGPLALRGRRSPLVELLLGAFEESQRGSCKSQAGDPGAAALAEQRVGEQWLGTREPPAGAAAGTTP
jgi:hypothetical protein